MMSTAESKNAKRRRLRSERMTERRDKRRLFRLAGVDPDVAITSHTVNDHDARFINNRKRTADAVKNAIDEADIFDDIEVQLDIKHADPFYRMLLSRLAFEDPDVTEALIAANDAKYASIKPLVPGALYAAFTELYSHVPQLYETGAPEDEFVHEYLRSSPSALQQLRKTTKRDLYATAHGFKNIWEPILDALTKAVDSQKQQGQGQGQGQAQKQQGKGQGQGEGEGESQGKGEGQGEGEGEGDGQGQGQGQGKEQQEGSKGKSKGQGQGEGEGEQSIPQPKADGNVQSMLSRAAECAEGAAAARDSALGVGRGNGNEIALPPEAIREAINCMVGSAIQSKLSRIIAEMVGRFKSSALSFMASNGHSEGAPVGFRLGSDLSRATPAELVRRKLSRLDFLSALAEGTLLETDTKGPSRKGRGPVIVLCDESGSMKAGTDSKTPKGITCSRATWTAAFSQGMAKICQAQGRPFIYVPFGDGIAAPCTAEEVAVKTRFDNGGTCIEASLLETMALVWPEIYGYPEVQYLDRTNIMSTKRLEGARARVLAACGDPEGKRLKGFRDNADILLITDDCGGVSHTMATFTSAVLGTLQRLGKKYGTRLMAIRMLGNAEYQRNDQSPSGKEKLREHQQMMERVLQDIRKFIRKSWPDMEKALARDPYGKQLEPLALQIKESMLKSGSITASLTERFIDVVGSPLHDDELEKSIHRFLLSGGTR